MNFKEYDDKVFTAMNHLVQAKEQFTQVIDHLKEAYPWWEVDEIIEHIEKHVVKGITTALNKVFKEHKLVRDSNSDPKDDLVYGKEDE